MSETPSIVAAPLAGVPRFAHAAMAAEFEIFVSHADLRYAQQAAWAAFEVLDRLDRELSRFMETSDIARINTARAGEIVRVGPAALECLQIADRLAAETRGAFDPTAGRLVDFWRRRDPDSLPVSEKQLRTARSRTGMHLLDINPEAHTVCVRKAGVCVDLGGIGKGFALDQMARTLRVWEIDAALLHSGHSTALAFGARAPQTRWPVALAAPETGRNVLGPFALANRAISGSGLRKGLHIIDPRTGHPVRGTRAAWSLAPNAAEADALSTAFMVMSESEIAAYCAQHPDVTAIVLPDSAAAHSSPPRLLRFGRAA
ncbi:MAG: FAD:protein FMN transferase [Candidatus Sumerlaeia bacterium]|nr:FAD:protein FMN transferase [Candidatus Sumerlaeia bacterium]